MTQRTLRYILLVAAGISLSACGSVFQSHVLTAPADSYGGNQSLTGSSANNGSLISNAGSTGKDYDCPAAPNVVPDYDWDFNGTGQYTVCTSKNGQSDILLYGKANSSNTICVFPAQYYDQTHIVWKPNLNTGLPEAQCIQIGSVGAPFSFTGMTYNALFVVAGSDVNQMQTCLNSGNYFGCPHYSFGVFR